MNTIPKFVADCVQQDDGEILLTTDIWEVACKLFPDETALGKKMRQQGKRALIKKVREKHDMPGAKSVYVREYGRQMSGWRGYRLTDEYAVHSDRCSEFSIRREIKRKLTAWCQKALVPAMGKQVKTTTVFEAALAAFEDEEEITNHLRYELGLSQFVAFMRVAAALPYSRRLYFRDVKGTQMGWKGYALNPELATQAESAIVEATT